MELAHDGSVRTTLMFRATELTLATYRSVATEIRLERPLDEATYLQYAHMTPLPENSFGLLSDDRRRTWIRLFGAEIATCVETGRLCALTESSLFEGALDCFPSFSKTWLTYCYNHRPTACVQRITRSERPRLQPQCDEGSQRSLRGSSPFARESLCSPFDRHPYRRPTHSLAPAEYASRTMPSRAKRVTSSTCPGRRPCTSGRRTGYTQVRASLSPLSVFVLML